MDALAAEKQQRQGASRRVRELSNDALIIDLLNTLNHLSRWLTPIHDRALLEYSPRRSDPSVKETLIDMRDTEARLYSLMYVIASRTHPNLDQIPRVERTPLQVAADRASDPLVTMSGFRRVRESSTSLLRALPDTAWERGGYSRTERNWTIRELGEYLAEHDRAMLGQIDRILSRGGARQGISEVSRVSLERIDETFVSSARRE